MTDVKDHSTPIGFEAFSRLVDLVCEADSIELYGDPKQNLVKPVRRVKNTAQVIFNLNVDFKQISGLHHYVTTLNQTRQTKTSLAISG